jgi:hypothetical protein
VVPPGITGRRAEGDGPVHGRWNGDQQAARTQLDRHVARHSGQALGRHVTDDDRHPPGELEERRHSVAAHVEHGVMRFDERIGEADGSTGGTADDVPAGAEADRRPDGWSGHLDDQHERAGWRVGSAHLLARLDTAAGSQTRPDQGRRRVDPGAVDRHACRRIDTEGTRELADRRAGVRPQLARGPVGSGHDEASRSVEVHIDLWVERRLSGKL